MKYYIGIEGGGTKTVAVLGNEGKQVLSKTLVGPTNYHSVGLGEVKEEISQIFRSFQKEQNIDISQVKGVCFGGAGVDNSEDERQIRSIFHSLGYRGRLHVCNDSEIALVGATGSYRGAILISGTGSISYGIDVDGKPVRVGGWGHLIDDEGSGYALAIACLKQIMKSYDGRAEKTLLWDKVKKKINLSHQEELISFIYDADTYKQHIAELATCVLELYGSDDAADRIIDDAIKGLSDMVLTLARRMQLDEFPLSYGGSLLLKSDIYRQLFEDSLKAHLPKVETHLPYDDAVHGALKLATG